MVNLFLILEVCYFIIYCFYYQNRWFKQNLEGALESQTQAIEFYYLISDRGQHSQIINPFELSINYFGSFDLLSNPMTNCYLDKHELQSIDSHLMTHFSKRNHQFFVFYFFSLYLWYPYVNFITLTNALLSTFILLLKNTRIVNF